MLVDISNFIKLIRNLIHHQSAYFNNEYIIFQPSHHPRRGIVSGFELRQEYPSSQGLTAFTRILLLRSALAVFFVNVIKPPFEVE